MDSGRAYSRLKNIREQLPLSPAFAMTAHASQGQTLPKAIVDLCLSNESNSIASYVALSRVRSQSDILFV